MQFDIYFFVPLIFSAIVVILNFLQISEDYKRMLYIAMIQIFFFIFMVIATRLNFDFFRNTTFFEIALGLIAGTLFYAIDLMILNMVKNDVLILDLRFYFARKFVLKSFLMSAAIAIGEEIVYRAMGLITITPNLIWFVVFSLCFGIVHLFLSRYDIFSKTILSFILCFSVIYFENISFAIVMHTTYNFWASLIYKGELYE